MVFFKRIQSKRTARIVIEGIIHLGDFFCQDPRVRPFLNQALKCHQLRGLPSTPSFMHHGLAQRIKTGGQIIRCRNLLACHPHAAHHTQIVGIVVFRVRRGTQWQLKNDARTPKRRFVPFASHWEAFPQQTIFQSKQQGFNRQIPRREKQSITQFGILAMQRGTFVDEHARIAPKSSLFGHAFFVRVSRKNNASSKAMR